MLALLLRPHARLEAGIVVVRHGLCQARAPRQLVACLSARSNSSRTSSGQVRRELRKAMLDVSVESRQTQLEGVDGPRGGGGRGQLL